MSSKEFENLPKIKQKSIFDPIPNVLRNPAYTLKSNEWPKKSQGVPEQISILWKSEKLFTFSESWAIAHQFKGICLLNTGTGYLITGMFRKTVNLTNPSVGALNLILPSVFGSFILEAFLHVKTATLPMALNPDKSHVPHIVESLGIHLTMSFIYQIAFISIGAVYFSDVYKTFAYPDEYFTTPGGRKIHFQQCSYPYFEEKS